MVNERTLETDLIEPALALIVEFGDVENGLEITTLARKLRDVIQPTEADLKPLKGRKDDRLSQVIRNLVSHRSLERRGLATYRKGQALTKGSYVLTDLGRASVKSSWLRKIK